MRPIVLVPVAAFGLWALSSCTSAEPAPQPPFETVATVEELMHGMVEPLATVVFESVGTIINREGVQELRPETGEEWDMVVDTALALGESANLLMFPSRAKDQGEWMTMASAMIEKSQVAAQAARMHDAPALFQAAADVYETCLACHTKYLVEEESPIE